MADPRPALVAAYRRITADTRARTLRHANGLWIQMGDWSDASADTMVSRLVPVVTGAERATAAATAAFLTQYRGIPARDAPPLDLAAVTGGALRGVDPQTVYLRSVIEARATYARLRDAGLDPAEIIDTASQAGIRRLLGAVGTDLQLAATHTADQQLSAAGITTYRRVTRAGACGLCVAASDRVYSVGDLLPIHTNCHCIVVPGDVLPTGLRRASNANQPTDGRGLRIGDNAEIGPVLDYDTAAAGSTKRTRKHGSASMTDEERQAMKRAQLAGYEKTLSDGKPRPWMEQKAAELRAELGKTPAPASSGGSSGGGLPPGGAADGASDGPVGPDERPTAAQLLAEGVIGRGHEYYKDAEGPIARWHDEVFGTRFVSVMERDIRFPDIPNLKTPDSVDQAPGADPETWLTAEIKQTQHARSARDQIRRGWRQSSRLIIEVLDITSSEAEELADWATRRYPGLKQLTIIRRSVDGFEVLARR